MTMARCLVVPVTHAGRMLSKELNTNHVSRKERSKGWQVQGYVFTIGTDVHQWCGDIVECRRQ